MTNRTHHAGITTVGQLRERQSFTCRIPRAEYLGVLQEIHTAIADRLGFRVSNSVVIRLAIRELARVLRHSDRHQATAITESARDLASRRSRKQSQD